MAEETEWTVVSGNKIKRPKHGGRKAGQKNYSIEKKQSMAGPKRPVGKPSALDEASRHKKQRKLDFTTAKVFVDDAAKSPEAPSLPDEDEPQESGMVFLLK
jgi:hypothetical protein